MRSVNLLALALSFLPTSGVAEPVIACDVADVLAEKAYQRVSAAMQKKQEVIAVVASQSFWDLVPYAPQCPHVAQRSADLNEAGFHKNLPDPVSAAVLDYFNQRTAAGSLIEYDGPRIIYTTEPSGGGAGEYRARDFYGFQGSRNHSIGYQRMGKMPTGANAMQGMTSSITLPGQPGLTDSGQSWLEIYTGVPNSSTGERSNAISNAATAIRGTRTLTLTK